MPLTVPVFAGLGSETLFSDEITQGAAQHAAQPECAVLLQSCHRRFLACVSEAIDAGLIAANFVDLDDFPEPISLVRPPVYYRRNVLIQHTTLYLQQILKYLAHQDGKEGILATAGFSAGLLPAAVIATGGSSILTLISRAFDFFEVTFWVGVRSEKYRREHLSCDPGYQTCSYVVDGLTPEEAIEFIHQDNLDQSVFVSAILSSTRLTLSGKPDELFRLISERLPAQWRARPAAVFSLYHNRKALQDVRDAVIRDLGASGNLLRTELQCVTPLLSSTTGEVQRFSSQPSMEEVTSAVLDMIFLETIDWVAVQDSISVLANSKTDAGTVSILNHGPGIGVSSVALGPKLAEHVNIVDTSKLIESLSPENRHSRLDQDDIAIVGMAVDLPGAPDTTSLWQSLMQGVNSCSEIPTSRFNVDDYIPIAERSQGGRVLKTRYGNFLKNPFLFDPELFDISRREARSMDPQQRILLQTAYRALEDAGYVPDSSPSCARESFGCWIGNATLDYVENLRDDVDVYYSTGTLRTFLSARLSYVFGWSGPSITLDTACSSSIVALHQAARSIMAGDCRSALVGAANTITSPDMYLGLDRAHFLSPSGQCKAFDASADGYCRAEGCGVFVIKKLSDAIAEGDRVHAVIKAVEINQSGNAHSITHPHVPTQEVLFEKMFRTAAIDPHDVGVVEMHGTGTQAGDPNEVESVRRAVCKNRSPRNPVHLTSIKANIGHAEAASGIAGLAKIVLMMKYGRIPPQISLKKLNPRIRPLGLDGTVIEPDGAEWPRATSGAPRIGMLNNFGAGGSNAAVILAEHLPQTDQTPFTSSANWVCGFSAKNPRVLSELQQNLIEYLLAAKDGPSPPLLADVCATLTSRRQLYGHRVAVTADSLTNLIEKIRAANLHSVSDSQCSRPEAVFVFSGQGSQYLGMGRTLLESYPDVAETVDECERWLLQNNYPGCLQIIRGETVDETSATHDAIIGQAFQTALFVLEVSVSRLFVSWGIIPSAVVGHSLGEYAALVTSGVISMLDGLKVVAQRARLMMEKCELGKTSMLAINRDATTVQKYIETNDDFSALAIACSNSFTDCVVGGPVSQLSVLKRYLTETQSVKSKLLTVPLAFHTSAMDPILAELTEFATREVQFYPPKVPIISNALGRTVRPGEQVFSAEYFANQCRNTVAFSDGIRDFLNKMDGGESDMKTWRWIEIGPHPTIQPMLRGMLKDAEPAQIIMPTGMKDLSSSETIGRILCHFYETSSDIKWRKVFSRGANASPKVLDLPGMPFFQEEFHVPYRELGKAKNETDATPEKLNDMIANSFAVRRVRAFSTDARTTSAIYDTPAFLLREFIEGHIVCGYALCPASVYHEMALAALKDANPEASSLGVWSLTKITYSAPFVFKEDLAQVLRVEISPRALAPHVYDFTVSSYIGSGSEMKSTSHCRGMIKQKSETSVRAKSSRLLASVSRKIDSFKMAAKPRIDNQVQAQHEQFSTRAMYEKLFTRVVVYSTPYQKVQSIRIDSQKGEALASCIFPESYLSNSGTIPAGNAIFMDVLLHVAGFVANLNIDNDLMGICKDVGAATVFRVPSGTAAGGKKHFDVYCSTFEIQEGHNGMMTIADAYAIDSQGVLAVFKGMVFQHVQIARIGQALDMATRSRGKANAETKSITKPKANGSTLLRNLASGSDLSKPMMSPTKSPRQSVSDLIARACGIDPKQLGPDTGLEALGVDSLMMIEIESEISTAFGIQISGDAMSQCTTVGDIKRLTVSNNGAHEEESVTSTTTSSSTSGAVSPITPASILVADNAINITDIIAEICGAEPGTVSLDSELGALGIDSLMSLEFEDRLRDILGDEAVSSLSLQECSTVMDVESLVLKKYEHSHAPTPNPPVALVKTHTAYRHRTRPSTASLHPSELSMMPVISKLLQLGRQPELIQSGQRQQQRRNISPLFLVHDGSGICTHYRRLRPLDRPVFALHDPKFLPLPDDERDWASLSEMAICYADIITAALGSQEDCLLGGWSFGGVVAFEAARVMMSRGRVVKGVVLIDSPPPLDHEPLSDNIISAITPTIQQEGGAFLTPTAVARKLVQQSFQKCTDLLSTFSKTLGPQKLRTPLPRVVLLRSSEGWKPAPGYEGPPIGERVNIWLQDRTNRSSATAGWEILLGAPVSFMDIPGDHFQVFHPSNIDGVSSALQRACLSFE